MQEKGNILRILKETKEAMKRGDAVTIKNLSNQTMNTASLTQDPDNVTVAVIVYSLGKVLERHHYQEFKGWDKFYEAVISSINHSIKDLESAGGEGVGEDLETITREIEKLSGTLKRYIKDVFWKARINKASRIYEHGISMEKTAKLLGITMYELASYAGQARIEDVPLENTMDVKRRIKTAMEMFK